METKRLLRKHQIPAFEYGKVRQHWAFFMEMRLGKTLVTIRTVQHHAQFEPLMNILVLAPLGALETWQEELAMEGEQSMLMHGMGPQQRIDMIVDDCFERRNTRVWCLMGYKTLQSQPKVSAFPWDVVILDESTHIKNWSSKITQICINGFRDAAHRCILSGLSAPETPLEWFPQFMFLNGQFMNHTEPWSFRHKYFMAGTRGKFNPKFGSRTLIKKAVHRKAFILTRHDAQMGEVKVYEKRFVDMSPEQAALHKEAKKTYSLEGKETNYAIVVNSWLQGLAGGFTPEGRCVSTTKLDSLVEILTDELHDQQVLVWFSRLDELHAAYRAGLEAGIVGLEIHGGTPRHVRAQYRQDFLGGKYRVAFMQEACAKYGNNWASADIAIYYSNMYSNETRAQSEDRIVDTQKARPLLYIDMVSRKSIDEHIVPLLQKKTYNAKDLLTLSQKTMEAWK